MVPSAAQNISTFQHVLNLIKTRVENRKSVFTVKKELMGLQLGQAATATNEMLYAAKYISRMPNGFGSWRLYTGRGFSPQRRSWSEAFEREALTLEFPWVMGPYLMLKAEQLYQVLTQNRGLGHNLDRSSLF